MRVDLAPMSDLVQRLGNPQEAFRSVHVGGSKGKGSVAALIAAGLGAAGLRVGRYASPHVERVNERLVIDGEEIADDALAHGIEKVLEAQAAAQAEQTPAAAATWFDLITAAAFVAMEAVGVGVAVVEVGLGGRLDSTNVLDPDLCVLTRIDLEHTDVLGGTREAIAGEKAGILKRGKPCVSAVGCWRADTDPGPARVIAERARELGCELSAPGPLEGLVMGNEKLAKKCLEVLGEIGLKCADGRPVGAHLLVSETVRLGARLAGRLEKRRYEGVPLVLDGAHVPTSLTAVLEELRGDPDLSGPCQPVLSLAKDKDARGLLKALEGHADRLVCTCVGGGRHWPADELAGLARELGFEAMAEPDAGEALAQAKARAGADGWVLVTGSLYLVGALRPSLPTQESPPCSPSAPTSS
ncbi:MAG TPA: bifunctional folylpolyglutamate synthase/dihydrofolate synthase [Planctomycetes bacterium]|nr:bifunctional folylpolyglutamate synthase/dihydrofolate synthase [Planctomycetota bacterium]HIK59712.1 bifunctional folylpolyglutamate synthase/dihydrofolate synthase [Planctomycetota bacterium]